LSTIEWKDVTWYQSKVDIPWVTHYKPRYLFDARYNTAVQKESAQKVWNKTKFSHLYALHNDFWPYLVELVNLLLAEPLVTPPEEVDEAGVIIQTC